MYIIRVKPRLFHQPCARAPKSGAFYLYIYIYVQCIPYMCLYLSYCIYMYIIAFSSAYAG